MKLIQSILCLVTFTICPFLFPAAQSQPEGDNSAGKITTRTPEDGNPRSYFKEASTANIEKVILGLDQNEIRSLLGGEKYGEFETIRGDRFAFSVDWYPAGVLSLPGKIRLDQEIDFFVTSEREKALVAFYEEDVAAWILIFDFATGVWDKREANQEDLEANSEYEK